MSSAERLNGHRPFGIDPDTYPTMRDNGNGVQIYDVRLGAGQNGKAPKDKAATWLRNAMVALAVLAVAAAVVSYAAQFKFVYAVKHLTVIAGIQAGIPDAGAAVFAALGIALALQGKRAVRSRILNVLCVGVSIGMNALAASHGYRALAVWVMAPVIYALASDTLIGVVRAYEIARLKALNAALADDEATPLTVVGGLLLWVLRLTFAPVSTLGGFRGWVLTSVKVAPGTYAALGGDETKALPPPRDEKRPSKPIRPRPARKAVTGSSWRPRAGTANAALIDAVEAAHGPLAEFDLAQVSKIATGLAEQVGMHPGTARSQLRKYLLRAQEAAKQVQS